MLHCLDLQSSLARVANKTTQAVARMPDVLLLSSAAKPIAYGGGVGHAPTDARRLAGGYRGTPSPSLRKLVEAAQPRNGFWAGMNRHLYRASHQAGIAKKSDGLARLDFGDLLAQFDQSIGFHQRRQ